MRRHELHLPIHLIEPIHGIEPIHPMEPICLTAPGWRSQLRSSLRQAGEALAVIASIVAVGLIAVAL